MLMQTRTQIAVAVALFLMTVGVGCDQTEKQIESVSGFQGEIGRTFAESVEDWPKEPVFTGEEPNVLLILLDDVGYSQSVASAV